MPTPSSSSNEFVLDYKTKNGRPYIADYLDSAWLYRDPATKGQMDTVDEWINYEIVRLNLKPSNQAYAEVFTDLTKRLGLHKYASASEKLKKVSILLKEAVEKQRYFKKMGIDLKSIEDFLSN